MRRLTLFCCFFCGGVCKSLLMSGLMKDSWILLFVSVFSLIRYHVSDSLWKTLLMREEKGKWYHSIISKVLTLADHMKGFGERRGNTLWEPLQQCSNLGNREFDQCMQGQPFHTTAYPTLAYVLPQSTPFLHAQAPTNSTQNPKYLYYGT